MKGRLLGLISSITVGIYLPDEWTWHIIVVLRQECGQTWTRVRVWTSIYCSDNY